MFPKSVAVIGAAGGLGSAIISQCIKNNIKFTAIVRGRPERIPQVPVGSRVVVVKDLADENALKDAFTGNQAIITATGPTATSNDSTALLSKNMDSVSAAMKACSVSRLVIVNTIISNAPGQPGSWVMTIFSAILRNIFWGNPRVGLNDMKDLIELFGTGKLNDLSWTIVRAAVNSKGADVDPVCSENWEGTNSMSPVSYSSMAKWMLKEAAESRYIHKFPVVSKGK